MEQIGILTVIISLAILIVFFVMAQNINSILKELRNIHLLLMQFGAKENIKPVSSYGSTRVAKRIAKKMSHLSNDIKPWVCENCGTTNTKSELVCENCAKT